MTTNNQQTKEEFIDELYRGLEHELIPFAEQERLDKQEETVKSKLRQAIEIDLIENDHEQE